MNVRVELYVASTVVRYTRLVEVMVAVIVGSAGETVAVICAVPPKRELAPLPFLTAAFALMLVPTPAVIFVEDGVMVTD